MSWDFRNYKKTSPITTDKGIQARSKRGDFVENWWAQRWIKALEKITDAGRLRRGRTYARKGQVLSIEERAGGIQARVQGSRRTPYSVEIRTKPLSDREWEQVIHALAEQALFSAQLLAGEMPQQIEAVFAEAGVSLFPDKRSDLTTECSCPDWANPCKHVAAAHYILGEQFDIDPFLLFRLRGRDQEEIVDALRRLRTVDAEDAALQVAEDAAPYAAESDPPLEESLEDFWRMGTSLDQFSTHLQAPTTDLPVLRRLGQPAFLSTDVKLALGSIYAEASRSGLEIAYEDDGYEDTRSELDEAAGKESK